MRRDPYTSDLSASQDITMPTLVPGGRPFPLPGDPVDPGPLLTRLRGLAVNVRDVGAAGDGATDDTGALADAFASGAPAIYIPPGNYYVGSTLTLPSTCHLSGAGPSTVLAYYGTGPCISMHGATAPGSGFGVLTHAMFGGSIRDLLIDGSGASSGAAGIEFGDAWGYVIDHVVLCHFNQGTSGTGTAGGSAGLHGLNSVFWTEKCRIEATCFDCTTAATFEQGSGEPSFEYNDVRLLVLCSAGQDGLCLQNGGYMAGGSLAMRGNFDTSSAALTSSAVRIQGAGSQNSHIQHCRFDLVVEANNSRANGPITFAFGSNSNSLHDCTGQIAFQDTPWTPAQSGGGALNTGQVSLRALVQGDDTLQAVTTPAVPATNNTITNNQNDATAYITGGTVSAVTVQGAATGLSLTAGQVATVRVPHGGTIKLNYSVAPTWVWVSDI